MLLFEAGDDGQLLSLDLFVFFVFFEIVPMYFLGSAVHEVARPRPPSSSCTRWSARRSCSSASSPRRCSPARTVSATSLDLVEIAENADFATSTGRWLFFAIAVAFA
ncbi:MAG: hypothetical protein R2713_20960 [Ilumatobacteraceae bacterium]